MKNSRSYRKNSKESGKLRFGYLIAAGTSVWLMLTMIGWTIESASEFMLGIDLIRYYGTFEPLRIVLGAFFFVLSLVVMAISLIAAAYYFNSAVSPTVDWFYDKYPSKKY